MAGTLAFQNGRLQFYGGGLSFDCECCRGPCKSNPSFGLNFVASRTLLTTIPDDDIGSYYGVYTGTQLQGSDGNWFANGINLWLGTVFPTPYTDPDVDVRLTRGPGTSCDKYTLRVRDCGRGFGGSDCSWPPGQPHLLQYSPGVEDCCPHDVTPEPDQCDYVWESSFVLFRSKPYFLFSSNQSGTMYYYYWLFRVACERSI